MPSDMSSETQPIQIIDSGEPDTHVTTQFGEQEKKEKKKIKELENFGKVVERLHRIELIHSTIDNSEITPIPEHKELPNSEEIEEILNFYEHSPDDFKESIRNDVTDRLSLGIKRIRRTLTSDIVTLSKDRGDSEDEAAEQREKIDNPIVGNKRKSFGNINPDEQIRVLEEAYVTRNNLILENVPVYLNILSTYKNKLRIGDDRLNRIKIDFDNAEGDAKLKIAAKIRKETEFAINDTFEINLQRLRELKTLEGENENDVLNDISELRVKFQTSSIPRKASCIEEILEKKAKLAKPYLSDFIKLRGVIENEVLYENELADLEDEEAEDESLDEVLEEIDNLLTVELVRRNGSAFGLNPGTSVAEMEDLVRKYTKKHEDPSLLKIFKRVTLLRSTPDEFDL